MSPMHLNGVKGKMSFICRNRGRNEQMDRRFMFMKIFLAQAVVFLPRGYIYICI